MDTFICCTITCSLHTLQERKVFRFIFNPTRLLPDREEREVELRTCHLLGGVLVPVFQPGESPDPHHHQAVSSLEGDARRFRRYLHLHAEPRLHHLNARLVARVEAGGHAPGDGFLCLLHRKLLLTNGAIRGKHAGSDPETEVCCFHI